MLLPALIYNDETLGEFFEEEVSECVEAVSYGQIEDYQHVVRPTDGQIIS